MASDLNWLNIDPSTLPVVQREQFEAYKVAYKQAATLRKAFEEGMNDSADLPVGKVMKFGYMYGKLSIAIAEGEYSAPKAKASALSLADFLARAANSGRHA